MADIRRTKLPVYKQTVSTSKTSTGTKKAKQTQPKTVTKTTVTKKPTVTAKKSKTETAIQNITKIAKEQKPIVKLDSLADYRKAERLNTQFYENVKKGTEALQKAKKTTQKKTSTEKIKNIADVMQQDREDVSLSTHYDNTKKLAKKLDDFEKSVVIQRNANAYKSAKSAEQKNKLHTENEALAESMGLKYDSTTGLYGDPSKIKKIIKQTQKTVQKPASNTQKQIKMTSMKGDKVTMKPRTKAERQEELKSVKRAGIEAAKELVEFGLRANEAVVNSPLRLDKLLQKANLIQKSKQAQPSLASMTAKVVPDIIEATKPKLKTKQAEQSSDIAGFVGGMFLPIPGGKQKAVEKIATKAEKTVAELLKTNPAEAIKVAREAFEAKGLKGLTPKVTAPAKERQTGRWVIKNTADKSIAKVVDTKEEAIAAVRKEANAIKAKKQAEVDANPDAVIDAVVKKYGNNPTQKNIDTVVKQMTSAKKKEIPVYIHPEYKTAETAKELTPLKNIEDAIKYKTKKQLKQEKKAAQKGVSTRDVFVREIFDDLDELAKTEKALNVQQGKTILKGAEREGLQSAESSLYKRARLYKGAQGKVAQDVKDAEAILNTLGKEYGGVTPQELSTYAAARRAKWLKEQRGIETGFSPESVNATLAKYANNPAKQAAMDKASDALVAKQNQVLIDSIGHQFTADEVKAMIEADPYHVTFSRIDDNADDIAQVLRDSHDPQKVAKYMEGSTKDIQDPLTASIKSMARLRLETEKNKVYQQFLQYEDNDFFRRLRPEEVRNAKNHIGVWLNGKKQYIEVRPEMQKALESLDPKDVHAALRVFTIPSQALRAGSTLTLDFMARNPIRDIAQAYINTGMPPTYALKGLWDVLRQNPKAIEYLRNNGGMGGFISGAGDIDEMGRALRKFDNTAMGKKFVDILKDPQSYNILRPLQMLSEATEMGTKTGAYKYFLDKGYTAEEAAYQARDLMDFAMGGTVSKNVNKVTAFFNSQMVGKYKFYRALKKDPKGVVTRLFVASIIPSLTAVAATRYLGTEDQQAKIADAPGWLKNNFYLFPIPENIPVIGGKIGRIPKAFESAPISTLIEDTMNYYWNNDPTAFDNAMKELFEQQGLGMGTIMPTAVKPIIEGITNYSMFRKAPLIPYREKNPQYSVPSEEQYDVETPYIARALAGMVAPVAKGLGAENFASPRVMENLITGYTGGLGRMGMQAADTALGIAGVVPKKNLPAKDITQAPLAGAFLMKSNISGKSMNTVFEELNKLSSERKSLKSKNKELSSAKEGKYQYLSDVATEIGEMSEAIRLYKNDPNYSRTEKKKKIDELIALRNDYARRVAKYVREQDKKMGIKD